MNAAVLVIGGVGLWACWKGYRGGARRAGNDAGEGGDDLRAGS